MIYLSGAFLAQGVLSRGLCPGVVWGVYVVIPSKNHGDLMLPDRVIATQSSKKG